jgi:hypothetical protein
MRWVIFVLGVLPLFSYGALNVVTPRTTIAWQIRSTARRREGDPRRSIGTAFQSVLGVTPGRDPDRVALRRIRMLGVIEMAVAIAFAVALLATA